MTPHAPIELLAPAKNLEFGREAINHGADAVYIGAPAFGARQAATNSIADVEALARYAHLYRCRVFATVNTILFDNELQPATDMIRRLYEAGVDALIVQDMGLLECDLPPIELHASTQCHNYDVERIRFLERVGFRRIILARECSLEQMRAIRASTRADLEAFVHGALCVSFSGQCYMSQYLTGRSGNRGQCSQPCRSAYDLVTADGRTLVHDKHLLSLRDFSAAGSLADMIEAGITSLKIEGRLKDLGYVKNITAHYRQLLDGMQCPRPSEGQHTFFFTPDPDRTFNRTYTDYFLHHRQPMASMDTQKSRGQAVGKVTAVGRNTLTVGGDIPLTAGDGLCHFDAEGHLQGFLVNQVQGRTIVPNRMPDVKPGTPLWRNHDQAFERLLQSTSATRKIGLRLRFEATPEGFSLTSADDGTTVCIEAPHEPSRNAGRATEQVAKQLSKLGDTPFTALAVADSTGGQYFIAAATLNALRRQLADALAARREACRPPSVPFNAAAGHGTPYPAPAVDYRANVTNRLSEQFYRHHGATVAEHGLEQTADYGNRALMTTRYCLRFELGCCLQGKSKAGSLAIKPADSLFLLNNGRRFPLRFDCRNCRMQVMAPSR